MITISCGSSYRIHYDRKDNSFNNNPGIYKAEFHVASPYNNAILYHNVVKYGLSAQLSDGLAWSQNKILCVYIQHIR